MWLGWALAHAEEPGVPPPIEVTLVDPGRGARRPLRVGAEPGAWQLQVRRTARTGLPGPDGVLVDEEAPPAVSVLDAVVDAGARVSFRLVDLVGVDPLSVGTLDRELRAHAGLAYRVDADPRQVTPWSLDGLGDDASETLAALVSDVGWALEVARVPLPDEPVARGARWTWRREGAVEGLALTQAWSATLVGRKGPTWVVDVALAASLDDAATDEVRIESLSLGAEGTVWIDRRRPLPAAAELSLHADLVFAVDGSAAQPGTLDTKVVIASRPSPGGAPPVSVPALPEEP